MAGVSRQWVESCRRAHLDTLTGPGRGSADLLMATVWSN
ncbi:hypothetical protein SGL43_07423 [Streptomyces globisporus]|uniref:Uncharacterized protein n=1 Tax=Streptomyces globisporus TaxID=1908 RepID=A0ABN8VF19_STRGL|nr:hypothetical protein SGL43_07423 [Streptomyces globisporus]